MPEYPGRLTATAALVTLGALTLGGCMAPEPAGPSGNEQRSAAHGRQIEQDLPPLVQAAGWDGLGELGEKSCLGDPDPAVASRETKWIGSASRSDVPEAQARELAARIARQAEEMGWSAQDGAGPSGDRVYGATKEDLTLVVSHRTGGGRSSMTVAIHSPCLEMPEGHTMVRSGLDPDHGAP